MRSKDFSNKTNIVKNERNRKIIVWQTVVHVYKEFSSQSTIHGIKYTTQAKTTFGRCLWFIVVSMSIIAAWLLADKFYERHESANMRTLVMSNQYPSWRLELPAITFCHSDIATMHRFATSVGDKRKIRLPFGITPEDFKRSLKYVSIGILPSNQYERELRTLDTVLAINRMSLAELFEIMSPKCSDFLVMCQFEGRMKNCESYVSPSYTPHGICCSINYAYIKSERRWNTTEQHDHYSVNFGAHYIFSFLVKSFGPEDRISSMTYGDGIKVLIHSRNTYPGPASLEFVAPTGHETVARLYGRHLTASVEVLSMKPTDRDCEKSTNMYRSDNCYVKCRENTFLHYCGCLPFFSSEIKTGQMICNITHVPCLTRVKQEAYSLKLRDPVCGCLPDCESTTYSLVTTSLPFNAARFNPSKFYQKVRDTPNASAIHITFSEQSGMLQRRELVLSWINLVSNLGGVFSLFLGCSFISIIEIIYFFVIYLIIKLRDNLRTTATTLGTT